MVTDANLASIVSEMRLVRNDLQRVEVKAAVGKLPKTVPESVSALTNGSGGVVILGLSESEGFAPAPGFDAHAAFDALAGLCADKLTPPIRPDIRIAPFEGALVVVAEIPETAPISKPCYVTERGMYRGSFIRTGDGDRLLSQYEIDRLLEEKTQPRHDLDIVEGATMADLDPDLVAAVLRRQRELHPRIFARLSDEDALAALNVTTETPDGGAAITLAGLLALGTYPQHFFPRLTVTFAAFPGVDKAQADGVKFADSQSMAGPIPAVLLDTVAAVRRNMRIGGVLVDGLRFDLPDYPPDAVREAVCNALMHRDYSPMGRGAQVQVNMYADRLEVLSPGGLYGPVTVDLLGTAGASATRNQHLSVLLETTPYAEGGFVAENRGTGFRLMEVELAAAGMRPPEVVDRPSLFALTFRKRDSSGDKGAAVDAEVDAEVEEDCRRAGRGLDPGSHRDVGHNTSRGEVSGANQAEGRADTLQAIVAAMRRLGDARTSDVAKTAGIPRSTAAYGIRRLLEQGVLEAAGPGDASKNSPTRSYRLAGAR